ncbi:bifunctional precorrin-2 dehydrogenase/sirohydrochlorin ferrochelatase [Desulfurivibrio sp. D14AmB]|uniref:precorrin-2 dehydrogenase/sirohydrochlorin ferrochelatase family protein n=1 Tax=Desulfurivibrio sp. D14AmB TaxID=3374370 RepID=UPI00376EC616
MQLARRPCVVVGGGAVARRKVEGLLACEAAVTVISPRLDGELERLRQAGALRWLAREYREGDLAGAFLVIAATDDEGVQARVHAEAERDNLLLNVADVPKWCNLILPAVVRRGDLSLAVSTGGASPALAARLRRELEDSYGDEYRVLLALLAALRPLVIDRGEGHQVNCRCFKELVAADLAGWIREGRWDLVREHVEECIGSPQALAVVDRIKNEG